MATTLYGPDGQPIDISKLKEEQARPTVAGVRQIISGHPAQGLTPGRLAALLRQAEQNDAVRYLDLAEEMEEKDLHYASVLGTRKRSVTQLDITVEAASDSAEDQANAELVKAFLNREELEDELFDILDGIGKGYSATEIIWDTSERQWMPLRLEWRFPQWFEFDRIDGKTLLLKSESGGTEPLAPYKFIKHMPKAKSGLPIRGGLARGAAWAYLFKNYDLKDWIAFIEIYGQPLRVGKYGPGATPAERDILLQAVANIGSDAAAIIPQSMMIEFVEGKIASNVDLFERFADYLDRQISKLVLGQTLTTEPGDSGSYSLGKVHGEVKDDIERSDCKQLGATLNRDLVRPIVDLNRGPQKAYPRIRIGRPEEADVEQLSDALAKLVPLGLKVKQAEVRQKIGVSDPEPEDELLAPASASSVEARNAALPPADPAAALARAVMQRRGMALAATQDPSGRDSIDGLVDGLDGWVKIMTPLIEPIVKRLDQAESIDEARDLLLQALAEMNTAELEQLLARSVFAARLAGEMEVPISDQTTPG